MKYKVETRTRWVDLTVDGKTQRVEEKYKVQIPIAPRDWDQIATRVGVGLVYALTGVSVVWSTIAIGDLLGGGVGLAAGSMFDVSWAVCLILEWKARFDPSKRAFPRGLGWALMATTMFFIGWHGVLDNNIPLAVVGASVSLFAKVLWLGIMKHIDRELSPQHLEWVKQTVSEANAKIAVAEVLRQVARLEDSALAQKLALEGGRAAYEHTAEQVPSSPEQQDEQPEHADELLAEQDEQPPSMLVRVRHSGLTAPILTGDEHVLGASELLAEQRVEQVPSMAELARRLLASGMNREMTVTAISATMPSAKLESIKAEVRRQAKKLDEGTGQYL